MIFKLVKAPTDPNSEFYADTQQYIDWSLSPNKEFHYNHLPRPFVEISKDEFERLSIYSVKYKGVGLVQGRDFDPNSPYYLDRYHAEYFFFAHVAVAKLTSNSETRYFRLGCEHVWEVIDKDYYEETCKCSKCGLTISFPTGH